MNMKMFQTPLGKAGCDQVDAMIESVHSEIEQMFTQFAKRRTLEYGVGRTTARLSVADSEIQLDAQKRESEAQLVFHAGRALELALHVVYARGADRILGREYPGVSDDQIKKDRDRKSHNLEPLYGRILQELSDPNMKDAFEDVYQRALHDGVIDMYLDEKLIESMSLVENLPFREVTRRRMMDGAEMTLDHSGPKELMRAIIGGSHGESEFIRMPHDMFESFLTKADAVYYKADSSGKDSAGKRKNMRWAHYSARDHEYGRPYVVVGTEFFARLVKGIIELSDNQSTWNEDFAKRWHERRQHNIKKIMDAHARQNYRETMEFPEMIPIEQAMERFRSPIPQKLATYDSLHKRCHLRT